MLHECVCVRVFFYHFKFIVCGCVCIIRKPRRRSWVNVDSFENVWSSLPFTGVALLISELKNLGHENATTHVFVCAQRFFSWIFFSFFFFFNLLADRSDEKWLSKPMVRQTKKLYYAKMREKAVIFTAIWSFYEHTNSNICRLIRLTAAGRKCRLEKRLITFSKILYFFLLI